MLLPLCLALLAPAHALYTNEQNIDKKIHCWGDIYDVLEGSSFNKADYEDYTALCAASKDANHPTYGCDCSTGTVQCHRSKANITMYDFEVWPAAGNVSMPIDFSWACQSDCTCNGEPPPYLQTIPQRMSQQSLTQVTLSKSAQNVTNVGHLHRPFSSATQTSNITCVGPMPDIDLHNTDIQSADYPDLQTLCAAATDNHPTLGCDCSGLGGNATCSSSLANPLLYNGLQQPPGTKVVPIALRFLCENYCFCPSQEPTPWQLAWDEIWSDGTKYGIDPNNKTILELMPIGMGRNLSQMPADEAADITAGIKETNLDILIDNYMNQLINSTNGTGMSGNSTATAGNFTGTGNLPPPGSGLDGSASGIGSSGSGASGQSGTGSSGATGNGTDAQAGSVGFTGP